MSRYHKFEYFIHEILQIPVETSILEYLLEKYSKEVRKELLSCQITDGLKPLREKTKHARWIVVSGGDQNELRDIFKMRQLDLLFDGGIFGSPDTKEVILSREQKNLNIKSPTLFIGDSKYDHQAATQAGLDFIFMSKWTEFDDWKNYQKLLAFKSAPDLLSLLNY